MEIIFQLLIICLVSLALAAGSSSASDLLPPLPLPPLSSSLVPEIRKGLVPSPGTPFEFPKSSFTLTLPHINTGSLPPQSAQALAPLPSNSEEDVPSPNASPEKAPTIKPPFSVPVPAWTPSRELPNISPVVLSPPSIPRNAPNKSPISEKVAPAPVSTRSINNPPTSPAISPTTPSALPPDVSPKTSSNNDKAPAHEPIPLVASPPRISGGTHRPSAHPTVPRVTPSGSPDPATSPVRGTMQSSPSFGGESPSLSPANDGTPIKSPSSSVNGKKDGTPVASPPIELSKPFAPMNHSPSTVASPPRILRGTPPPTHPILPRLAPSSSPDPARSTMRGSPQGSPILPGESPALSPADATTPLKSPSPSVNRKNSETHVASPPVAISEPLPPVNHSPSTVASPPTISRGNSPAHPTMSRLTPSSSPYPTTSTMRGSPQSSPILPGESPSLSPADTPTPPKSPPQSFNIKNDGTPVASPPFAISKPLPPANHSPSEGSSPAIAPSSPKPKGRSYHIDPSISSPISSPNIEYPSPSPSPLPSFHRHQQARNKIISPAPASSYPTSPPPSKPQASVFPPSRHYALSPLIPGSLASPAHPPVSPSMRHISPTPSPSPTYRSPKVPSLPPLQAFPPPPPNADCSSTICTEPYTNTPPGSPCGCVRPMQIGLQLSVALYIFFPSVSGFAQEFASGVFMKQSQVRIMGANAAMDQPEKSIVLIYLVPLGKKFDNTTAFLTFQRLWSKKVAIDASLFGDYEVLYVRYPGLPSSPPGLTITDDSPYSGNDRNGRTIKPLGVDVRRKKHRKKRLNGGTVAIIVLSASAFVGLCFSVSWVLLFKQRDRPSKSAPVPQSLASTLSKPSGSARSISGSRHSSASLSLESNIVPYTGSAKTFTASEVERATDNFNKSRVLGEGGFGRVYGGALEDGTKVAVKVLIRDDRHGSREFLAEVEMLSRLHHRNLVNLIGICTEDRNRCLVYELIPNGSVESHLHGVDRDFAPLDWHARMKIALGAARGLAYLHEDSSPRVIHRDFKSSNILLEHDFTPKVSDFGLARTAMEEENEHISTRVMGTFGYVAPEYAMTGHLLVKSDVYSYGVVLLELLTGRKPVEMSQPPGRENLVAWARPLLTSKAGLEAIIDPSLKLAAPFDSLAKVAAIASMCVQPEVSHRPFMGEVVQALKLVCNECDEAAASTTQEDFSVDVGDDA